MQTLDETSVKAKEEAITQLAALYAKQEEALKLRNLLTDLRPLFASFPKAKTAKVGFA